jgi:hypothetical protein
LEPPSAILGEIFNPVNPEGSHLQALSERVKLNIEGKIPTDVDIKNIIY